MVGRRGIARRPGLAAVAAVMLAALMSFGASPAAATETSIAILYAPPGPVAANTMQSFTAQIDPYAQGRTISWYVNGGLAATDLTNPNGVSQVGLTFGAGGYQVIAVLEAGDGWDRAQSEAVLLIVTQDPTRAPDGFAARRLEHAKVGTAGDDAGISVDRVGLTPSTLTITAVDAATGDTLRLGLTAPDGTTLGPGSYAEADAPREGTADAALGLTGPWPGCGSWSEGGFEVLSLERDAAGVPVSFAVEFQFRCQGEAWPTVGWVRYNTATPIPSLSLPDAFPVFDAVIQGETGTPKAFPITNDGEVALTLGTISMVESTGAWVTPDGPAAADYEVADDSCSGATLDPGEACSFELTFQPSVSGTRAATITVPSDAPLAPRRLDVVGQGLIPMTVGTPTVREDNQAFAPGVRYEATVTPNPQVNGSECIVDGVRLDGSIPDSQGVVFCVGPLPDPGSHQLQVHYLGSVFHGEAWSPVATFAVDPTTKIALTATATAGAANVPLTIAATTAFSGDVAYAGGIVTITDETAGEVVAEGTVGPGAPSVSVTRTYTQGAHHLVAAYAGVTGAEEPSVGAIDLAIGAPDLVTPTAAAPKAALLPGAGPTSGHLPVRLTWSGSDLGSGIDHYVLRQSVDGGPWTTAATVSGSAHADRALELGHQYRFAVRAVDRAGNTSERAMGASFRLAAIQEWRRAVRYRGTWRTSTGDALWGGSARRSSVERSTASITFTGRSIAWVGMTAPDRGRAKVYVGGELKATVDLSSTTTLRRRIVWAANYATAATRTITIKVLGTRDRPRVDLDGFVVAG